VSNKHNEPRNSVRNHHTFESEFIDTYKGDKESGDISNDVSVLEIGCADGVIFKAIEQRFPSRFKRCITKR